MKLSVTLDKDPLEEAQRLLEGKSKKRVIEEALKEFISPAFFITIVILSEAKNLYNR